MSDIISDLRYALRQLCSAPGFSITALLALAIGVGAACTIFSVLYAVLFQPLPFRHADRIVMPETRSRSGYDQPFSYPSYEDTRSQLSTFSAFAAWNNYFTVNLQTPSGPVLLHATKSTADFFRVFGVDPILGRTFAPGEDKPGHDNVAVLSYELWQRNFSGDRGVIGRTVDLDGANYTIIGVMPADFRFPLSQENTIYTPLHTPQQYVAERGDHWLQTVGLLKPGVTRQQAQADLNQVLERLGKSYPDTDGGRKGALPTLLEAVNADVRGPLGTLSIAVLALLAIGCVNLAGLLLARGVKREREIALRAAIGARRSRLVRQLVTESLLLATLGSIAAIAVAWGMLNVLRVFLVAAVERGSSVHLNLPVLAMAIGISAFSTVLASLTPALRLSRTDPNQVLKSGGSAGTGRSQHRVRSAFIVTQVALSLALVIVSGLLVSGILRTRHQQFGFDPAHVAAFETDLSPGRWENRNQFTGFYQPLIERVRRLPGVVDAGYINILPIKSYGSNSEVHVKGQPPYPPDQVMLAEGRFLSPEYFHAIGAKLLQGRLLNESLDKPGLTVTPIVVNEAFVRRFIPAGLNPVGAHLDQSATGESVIVGVVSDIRQRVDTPPLPETDYLAASMTPEIRALLQSGFLVVRTHGDPAGVYSAIREAMHEVDPRVPYVAPQTMDEVISQRMILRRLEGWLFGIFAGSAVILALIGLYGLISQEVELSTRDIGVRMALGATRLRVVQGVARRVALLLAIGVGAGWLLTAAAQRIIGAVIPIAVERDLALIVALGLGLLAAGLLVSLPPARRAAAIEPMEALRYE